MRLLSLGFIVLLLTACAGTLPAEIPAPVPAAPQLQEGCTADADCTAAEQCIDEECVTVVTVETDMEKLCETDADCICGGKYTESGACFIGSVSYYDSGKIDKEGFCPDFCTGIDGTLRTKCVNQQCALQTAARSAESGTGNLVLKTERTEGPAPFSAKFSVELTNVEDHDPEFYCAPVEWQYHIGSTKVDRQECLPYGPSSTITRKFETYYLYPSPGTYEVTARIGSAVSNRIAIAVSMPDGKSLRCDIPSAAKGNCETAFPGAFYYDPDVQRCRQVVGCDLKSEIPFSDMISCQLACEGGSTIGSCTTDADCGTAGCTQQWCMPAEMASVFSVPECFWKEEYRCYAQHECGCSNGRCTWAGSVESCLADYR